MELPMMLNGVAVYVSPLIRPVAKIKIRADFEWITDEARARIDAELLDMFGTAEQVIMMNGGAYVSPATYERLKKGMQQ